MSTTPIDSPRSQEVEPDPREISEVITSLFANGQALATKEIELLKLEIKELVREKAIAIGLVIVSAIFGLFVLAFIGVTAAAALMLVMSAWLAWLIVTVLYTLVVSLAILVAIRLAKRPAMQRTKRSFEETRDWARRQVQR